MDMTGKMEESQKHQSKTSKKLIHMFKHVSAVFVGYLTKQKSEKK